MSLSRSTLHPFNRPSSRARLRALHVRSPVSGWHFVAMRLNEPNEPSPVWARQIDHAKLDVHLGWETGRQEVPGRGCRVSLCGRSWKVEYRSSLEGGSDGGHLDIRRGANRSRHVSRDRTDGIHGVVEVRRCECKQVLSRADE